MTEPPAGQLPKSAAELEELVEAFEGKTRHPTGLVGRAITAALVVMSLYHLWATTANVVTQIHRTIHLLFVLVLTFLVYPGWKGAARRIHPTDVVLSLASAAALGYVFVDFEGFIYRAVVPTTWDLVFGVLTILLILEATRRSVGNALLVVVGGFILYAFAGPWLPAPWTHRGYDLARLVGQLYMTLEASSASPSPSRRRSSSCLRSTGRSSISPALESSSWTWPLPLPGGGAPAPGRRSPSRHSSSVAHRAVGWPPPSPWGPSPIRCCRKPDTTVSRPADCCRPAALAPSSPRPSSEPPRS